MQNNSTESRYHHEDEINLINLLKSLIERKWFIFGLTGFVALLAYMYTLSFTPYYQKTIDLTSPNEESVVMLNRLNLMEETRKTIYTRFLTKLSSKEFQKKVFFEDGYLTKLNPDNKIIDDTDDFAYSFISSVKLEREELRDRFLAETPHRLSMQGDNGAILSQFLNDLIHKANVETINDLTSLLKLRITLRLSEVFVKRESLLSMAKKERLNEIQVLRTEAQMAKSMGIKEHNFIGLSAQGNTFNRSIAFSDSDISNMPKWYLYGEIALLERIERLKGRTDDSPFIPELADLDFEIFELTSIQELISNEIQAVQISQNLPPNKIMRSGRLIIIVGFIVGLFLSIFLVLIFNALQSRDESIA